MLVMSMGLAQIPFLLPLCLALSSDVFSWVPSCQLGGYLSLHRKGK